MNRSKINILRFILCTITLCGVLVGMLIFQDKGIDVVYKWLENINPKAEGDMKNAWWLIERLAYILPVIACIIVQAIVYKKANKTSPRTKQREQGYEMLLAMIFVYAAMLPFAISYSKSHPGVVDTLTGTVDKTLIEKTILWFVWQAIFMLVVMIYHFSRADVLEDVITEDESELVEIENTNEAE